MTLFNALTMIGGLCLFLFGMDLMGQALERRAGGKLRTMLDKMTGRVMTGFLTGLAITAVIQSSSATTVMVVGFVNSGLMTLRQAINVIMGANVGTTVTAWLLSMAGISSGNVFINLLKPTSFTPVLALVGIIFYMFCKNGKKKDTGMILLGFATLMFGMDTMSGAVAGLKDVPAFAQLFIAFKNPVLGVLAGAVLTGIIQSSSASVGILQALAVTGQVSYAAAIPILMGQNIGTCVTALLSSVGTSKNARRAAAVHLMFNVIGVAVLLTVFCIVKAIFDPVILHESATMYGIAIAHSCFNIVCTAMLLPCGGLLERLAVRLVPDGPQERSEKPVELDERLLATPPLALQQCRTVAEEMAGCAVEALDSALNAFSAYTPELAERIRRMLDEGYAVSGGDGLRRCTPEDFVILMRSPRSRLKAFTAALAARNIPCAADESSDFFATVEIAVVWSLLQIIDNPRQDVPLISVLRSPLFGFTPDRLAAIRALKKDGDYYDALLLDALTRRTSSTRWRAFAPPPGTRRWTCCCGASTTPAAARRCSAPCRAVRPGRTT